MDWFRSSRKDKGSSSASPSPRSSSVPSRPSTPKPEDFLLRVTAGPNYDLSTHRIVAVNSPQELVIESEFMTVRLKIRIRGYNGLPKGSPSTSPYFSHPLHEHDMYSIAFTFVPKVDLPSTDLGWGNDFDHPIRDKLPPGFSTIFNTAKRFVDAGLECDAYSDEPWLYGPALSSWSVFRIGEKSSNAVNPALENNQDEAEDVIEEGADGSGLEVRKEKGVPDDLEKRRAFFRDEGNRSKFMFEKGRVYKADFFNSHLDFSNYSLRLFTIQFSVLKYIGANTHTLKYVFRNRKTDDVFFVTEIKLLHGENRVEALKANLQADAPLQQHDDTSVDDVD